MDEMEYEKLVGHDHSAKIHDLEEVVIAMRAGGIPFEDEAIQVLIDEAT